MVYIDKDGALRNSQSDRDAFTTYCRERVKLMKNSNEFLEAIELRFDREFDKAFPKKGAA